MGGLQYEIHGLRDANRIRRYPICVRAHGYGMVCITYADYPKRNTVQDYQRAVSHGERVRQACHTMRTMDAHAGTYDVSVSTYHRTTYGLVSGTRHGMVRRVGSSFRNSYPRWPQPALPALRVARVRLAP